jgi:hypothetical protein
MQTFRWSGLLVAAFLLPSCGSDHGGGPAPSSDARLSSLAVSTGVLSPVFDPDETFYLLAASILGTPLADSVTVTPSAFAPGATLLLDGAPLASGASSAPIDISGDATFIDLQVTAPDGITKQSYVILVLRSTQLATTSYAKSSKPDASDLFGGAIAISGDTLVVGASLEDSNAVGVDGNEADNSASSAGAAFVFVRTAGVWSRQAYLKASNTGSLDGFGASVAISGDTIVVGASGEDSNAVGVNGNEADNSAAGAGAAYVFVRTAGVWSQQAYLKASNTEAGDSLGTTLSISGDTLVVGAALEDSSAVGINGNQADNSAADSGAAYVFLRTVGVWAQQAYLKASNTDANDNFGYSVSISVDTVVVGAFFESSDATFVNASLSGGSGTQADNSAVKAGAAYVFLRSTGAWSQQAYLKASNTETGDFFGRSVATSGNTTVVGAISEDSNATGVNAPLVGGPGTQEDNSLTSAGAAYIFE